MKPTKLPRFKADPWRGVRPEPTRMELAGRVVRAVAVLALVAAAPLQFRVIAQLSAELVAKTQALQDLARAVQEHKAFDPNKACLGWWFGGNLSAAQEKARLCGR